MTPKWGNLAVSRSPNLVLTRPTIMTTNFTIPTDEIAAFCRRHHVRRLSLFGSVLRDDFTPGSDVDVLVEFEPGRVPGLAFFAMELELGEMLERKVELSTPAFLSRYIRSEVMAGAQVQYDAGG